jgi:hypothetical protein
MGKVILKLLCSLYSEKPVALGSETAELGFVVTVVSIAEFVGGVFEFEAHVSTDPTDFGIFFHMGPHFVDGILLRLDPDISQYTVFRIEQFAKALKKEHMR